MSSNRGSMTIEAAVVIPFVAIIFAVVIYMSHMLYVENRIHSNMLIAANEVGVSACILDKTGGINKLQKEYQKSDEFIGKTAGRYTDAKEAFNKLRENKDIILKSSDSILEDFNSVRGISDLGSLKDSAESIIENIGKGKDNIDTIIGAITFFAKNAKGIVVEGVKAGAISILSETIAENYVEYRFKSIISDEELRRMNVSNMDISRASYMLPDDTIRFSYSYDIYIPFVTDIFDDKYTVNRNVLVRAYTGSYDTEEAVNKKKKEKSDDNIVYVAKTSGEGICYHKLECLRKPVKKFKAQPPYRGNSVCKWCEAHKTMGKSVFKTSKSSKVHYIRECPRIYSADIKAMPQEEAVKRGYKVCNKRGCTGGK